MTSSSVALARSMISSPPSRDHSTTAMTTPTTTATTVGGSSGSDEGVDGSDNAESGLSTAAAAGIGVGSTVGGVLLLILVGWFVQRRKRLAPTASRAYDRPLKDDDLVAAGGKRRMLVGGWRCRLRVLPTLLLLASLVEEGRLSWRRIGFEGEGGKGKGDGPRGSVMLIISIFRAV
ncbi:hypothetical protein PG994_004155 [Apiospora phragmitis]|uniref:Uncharacterized protein n=1 Tax=Apiospora phragmitis TaxID=2905665 RepID=A0ABR1VPS9_9PEZI